MTPDSLAPRPWVFGIAAMPYGSFNGLIAVALPYMLRREGISVERIAAIAAIVQAPAIWYVLWAPAVDWRFRRRTWIVALSVASGAFTSAALYLTSKGAFRTATVLLVVASALCQPVLSALGGLVAAVMPSDARDRTAGWSQAGILGAGVTAGALVVSLTDHAATSLAAILAGLLIALPSIVALSVDEPLASIMPLARHVRDMLSTIARVVRRREVWLGAALFLSPIGAGALMNLFSSVAPDFRASSTVVVAAVAMAGALTACGAWVGGYLLERVDRWRAYPIAGLLTSIIVAGILVAPLNPVTYALGAALYALVTGFAYTAYMALALELIGGERKVGGTLFTLFTAAVNVPVVYMLRLDGIGHAHFGVRGMLAADGLANGIASILLLVVVARSHRREVVPR